MRTLKHNKPYKIHSTRLIDGKHFFKDGEAYYSRVSTISTKYGMVTASEMNWQTNKGRDIFTLFETALDGYHYSAWLNEAKLSERRLKWLSTRFIKQSLQHLTRPT